MRFTNINIPLLSVPFNKKIDSDFLNGLQNVNLECFRMTLAPSLSPPKINAEGRKLPRKRIYDTKEMDALDISTSFRG